MKSALRTAFENVKVTPSTRSDHRSLVVRVVERMKAQDSRVTRARAARQQEKANELG